MAFESIFRLEAASVDIYFSVTELVSIDLSWIVVLIQLQALYGERPRLSFYFYSLQYLVNASIDSRLRKSAAP